MSQGIEYQVQLASGRVLGPLDLERIRRLILKNQILGAERARVLPDGAWCPISELEAPAKLLLLHAQGALKKNTPLPEEAKSVSFGPAPPTQALPSAPKPALKKKEKADSEKSPPKGESLPGVSLEDDEKTVFVAPEDERTVVAPRPIGEDRLILNLEPEKPAEEAPEEDRDQRRAQLSHEPTLLIPALYEKKKELEGSSTDSPVVVAKKKVLRLKEALRVVVVSIFLGVGWFLLTLQPSGPKSKQAEMGMPLAVRPVLPKVINENPDPALSGKLYFEGLSKYIKDTGEGYKAAAEFLSRAVAADPSNVKALAMLASTYLNLIDSSNKDESYFLVIMKLIELSRARQVDLQETVIADVELYLNTNRSDAAQTRIVEYTKTHSSFATEMFYYLALTYFVRDDLKNAARFLSQIPENKVSGPRVFYLRGMIAEKLQEYDLALSEYQKAITLSPDHGKSRVRMASVLNQLGRLNEAGNHLKIVLDNPNLVPPRDQARAYYIGAKVLQLAKKEKKSFDYLEKAVALDPQEHDYLLEFYTAKAKANMDIPGLKQEAKMFLLLGEGERLVAQGHYHDALIQFLQARQVNEKSPIPLVKIGDMFMYQNDVNNAKSNYKLAADRAPKDIDVWTKYINALIQAFEWDEAQSAMARFRNLPVKQSAIDKAAADLYQKQGRSTEAQIFYRKAMARDSIDSTVYIAYAKSLMSTGKYAEAPFFFALASRFDPLNVETVVGTAKCIAETDSIERAIAFLQDEMQRRSGVKVEFITAIAEFQVQRGNLEQAHSLVDQALQANPEFSTPYKVLGDIYLAQIETHRRYLDKALEAYQAYSDRNPSDPSGYLERFKLYLRKAEFDKAEEELVRIYGVFPKYPKLHYYKGILYSVQGNHRVAIKELKEEVKNNSLDAQSWIQLGKSHLAVDENVDALESFRKAMSINPRLAEARHMAGYANYKMKNFEGAVALYQSALVLDPGNPQIYKRLAVVFKTIGNSRGAIEAARKYLQMEPDAPDRAEFEAIR